MPQTITGIAGTAIAAVCTGPSPGDLVTAASITVGQQSAENDLATIRSGTYTTTAGVTSNSISPQIFLGTVQMNQGFTSATPGLEVLGRATPRAPRVTLTDADQLVGVVSSGTGPVLAAKRFKLTIPSANRTITLKASGFFVPNEGETIEFLMMQIGSGNSFSYSFQREDTTQVSILRQSLVFQQQPFWAEFEFVSGVWRLGASSGQGYDGSATYGFGATAGA